MEQNYLFFDHSYIHWTNSCIWIRCSYHNTSINKIGHFDKHGWLVLNLPHVSNISTVFRQDGVQGRVALSIAHKNKSWQFTRTINEELLCESRKLIPSGSTKSVELDGLQSDLSKLIHILHVAKRSSVK
jgi:hypothetical protein